MAGVVTETETMMHMGDEIAGKAFPSSGRFLTSSYVAFSHAAFLSFWGVGHRLWRIRNECCTPHMWGAYWQMQLNWQLTNHVA
ncbi:MAG: hypothetical protein CL912_01385 [Deltaproteobacteria bacterium]|nr:hypothetical protein [Deltaproteobacteria bacterium]